MRLSALARALVALSLLVLPSVALAQFSVVRTSSPIFYNDFGNNPSLTGMYAAYEITNTSGSAYGDVWVDIGNFSGGVVQLSANDDGLLQLGQMNPGVAKMAYFYLAAGTTTVSPQTHSVRVYSSHPPGVPVVSQSFTISEVQSTIDANANKVNTVVTGPTPPTLGGIVTMTVSGETGTIGGSGILAFTPAAGTSWPANTYEMVSCTITFSGSANAGVLTDSLYWVAPSASNTNYVAVYRFRAVNSTAAPTLVTPIGYLASGANIKHTDTGGFGGFAPVPPAENLASAAKTATPTFLAAAGAVTYTLTFTNSAATDIDLSDIVDVLPGAATYVSGSTLFNGAAHGDPGQSGARLTWGGLFSVPAGTSRDLVYQMNLPAISGTYVNQAYGHIGPLVIDTTVALGDSVPASVPVTVDIPTADVSIVKTASPNPVTLGELLVYRLVVSNAGPDSATTTVADTLPAGVTFVSVTTTNGSASESGGIVSASFGPMIPGQVDTVTVTVTAGALGSLSNTASVVASEVDVNPGDNTSSVGSTVTASSDLQMVKRSNGPFTVGQPASYNLSLTNIGAGTTTGLITVVDTLPPGATYVGVIGPGWTANVVDSILTATHPGPIAATDSLVLTVQVALGPLAYPAIINTALVQTPGDESPDNDRGRDSTGVAGAPELVVTKTHAGSFLVNGTGTYTIRVTNAGTAPTSGDITVVDILAPGLTYVSSTGLGWTFNVTPPTVTATYSAVLAPSENAEFSIDVAIGSAAVPQVVNVAQGSTPGGYDGGRTAGRDTATVVGQPDLQLVKRHTGDFTVGGTHSYDLTLTNLGADVSGAITVLDTLPPGLTFVSAGGVNWSGSAVAQIVTLSNPGPLAPIDSTVVTLTVLVGASAAPGVINSAVASTLGDTDDSNDRSLDATVVLGAPDLALAKSHSPAIFAIGDSADYRLRVRNDGTLPTTGVIAIADTMPLGLGFGSWTGGGWDVTEASGIVNASHPGPLAPTDSLVLTLRVGVTASAAATTLNSAVASTAGDVNAGNDRAFDYASVAGAPDVQLVKRDVAAPFTVGAAAQYTLSLTNIGLGAAGGPIAVVDTLPVGLTYLGFAGAGWGVSESGGIVSASYPGPIARDDSLVLVLDVRPDAAAESPVTNAALATVTGDSNTSNNSSSITTPVVGAPDVRLSKQHAGSFLVGTNGNYTLIAKNIGTLPTTGATTVRDSLPPGLTYVGYVGPGWTVSEAGGIVDASYATAIAPSDSAEFTITVAIDPGAASLVVNSAVAQTPGDFNASNDRALDPTVVLAQTDVALAKRNEAPFVSQTQGSYTLTATNVGPADATGPIAVTDTLPPGLTYVSGVGSSWTIGESGGIVTATHPGPIAQNDSLTFQITVLVAAGLAPSVTNSAVVVVPGDVNAANDRAVNVAPVTGAPDVALAKSHSDPFSVGSTGDYTLTVRNAGDGPTTGPITVTDVLPTGLTYAGSSSPGWVIAPAGQTVQAVYGAPVAAGASVVLVLSVNVNAAAQPSVTNGANVATLGDGNAANNQATDLTNVVAAPDVALVKRHVAPFQVGQQGTYTLVATNLGIAPTGVVTVVDTLPPGLTFVSATNLGWIVSAVGQIVTANSFSSIAVADSIQFDIVVGVGAAALGGVVNSAVASTPGDVTPGNNRAVDPTSVAGAPDLAVTKRHAGTLTVGANTTYTIVATNLGSAATYATITVVDTLANGLSYVASTSPGWTVGESGGIVVATNPGPIAPADSLVLTLTLGVGPAAYPQVGNAAVAITTGDTDPSNNRGNDPPAPVVLAAQLVLEKTATPENVEIAEPVSYALVIRNLGISPVPSVTVRDTLPLGIEYADGTTSVDGNPAADPTGGRGPALEFAVGTVPAGGQVVLRYRAMVQATALQGDGINRALASNDVLGFRSNIAQATVHVRPGAFTTEGLIAGKVFIDCDCDSDRVQGHRDLGVPGVRLYLQDGRSAVTDVEGKYHFDAVAPRLNVVKVDATTLPPSARLDVVDTRDGLAAGSRFVDVKNGEFARADFVIARGAPETLADVLARRERGEVHAAIANTSPVAGGGGAYVGLEAAARDAANSNLPDAPGTPGILAGLAPAQAAGLEISAPHIPAPADGHSLVPVTVRVPGQGATPITLETDAGRFRVRDLDDAEDGVQTSVDHEATFLLEAPERIADAHVRVTLVDSLSAQAAGAKDRPYTGVAARSATIAFVNPARPWIVAGVLEGRYEKRSIEASELLPGESRDRSDDPFRTIHSTSDDGTGLLGARGAMFAKGTIGDGVLVTLRYDTERSREKQRFQDIRPDEGYTVFGDASLTGFETQSSDRAFARVEKDRSSLLWGDYQIGGTSLVRELSAYDRTLNGGLAHLENTHASIDAFASHERDRRVVDEIPGRGISGPYALSRGDGLANSARVEIVTRDRQNPSLILARRELTRFADYTIEAFSGRLLMRQPVPSVDERLNPVSIRVTYEVEGPGDRFWTAGAQGQIRPADRIELGGSYAKEDDPLDQRTLMGGGAALRILPHTVLAGEVARTERESADDGSAWRGELRHASNKLDLRGFVVRTDRGFDNPSAGFTPNRDEWGGSGRYVLDGKSSASLEGVRTLDRGTQGRRKGASLAFERRWSQSFRTELGYRWARESVLPAGGGAAVPTPNATDAVRGRLTAQLSRRTTGWLEIEKDVKTTGQSRAQVGADVRVVEHLRAYGRFEHITSFAGPYALNLDQKLNTAVLGLATDGLGDRMAFTEYRLRDAFSGREAEAAMGLRDRWRVSPAVVLDGSFERVQGARANAATAFTSGVEWTGSPAVKGSARLEYRTAASADQWLVSAGLTGKLSRDWTALARSLWAGQPGQDRKSGKTELALAFRETDRNHWNSVLRLDHRFEEGGALAAAERREALVFAGLANVHPAPTVTVTGQAATKWSESRGFGGSLRGQASLLALRGMFDLTRRVDVALAARTRLAGSLDRRNDGLGAELGFLMAKNLRLTAGYNAFGFHDADFSGIDRTDKGPYAGLGFKFDEGLFGGNGGAGRVSAADPDAASPTEAELRAPARADTTTRLTPLRERTTDQAIARDLAAIDGWSARARALPDSAGIYRRTKAIGWLELARSSYALGDTSRDAQRAYELGRGLVALAETPADSPEASDSSAARALEMGLLPSSDAPATTELLARAQALHDHPGFHCAAAEVARAEIAAAWAGSEAHAGAPCLVAPHVDEAKRQADRAQAKAEECVKPVEPVAPPESLSAVPPSAPIDEIVAALSEIPSGIHFALNRNDLSATSKQVIGRIAAVLTKYTDVRVELEGHTDSRGSAEYNMALSKRRVDAVKAGFVAVGIDSSRITTSFAGKANLLNAERDTRELALNRRVDFKYYDGQGNAIATRKQTEDIQIEKAKAKAKPKPQPR